MFGAVFMGMFFAMCMGVFVVVFAFVFILMGGKMFAMAILVRMAVFAVMLVFVAVMMLFKGVVMPVVVVVVVTDVNLESRALDLKPFFARSVKVITFEAQFLQFSRQVFHLDAEIEHRPHEHVAADSAENIQIKRFHFARALIWLAA